MHSGYVIIVTKFFALFFFLDYIHRRTGRNQLLCPTHQFTAEHHWFIGENSTWYGTRRVVASSQQSYRLVDYQHGSSVGTATLSNVPERLQWQRSTVTIQRKRSNGGQEIRNGCAWLHTGRSENYQETIASADDLPEQTNYIRLKLDLQHFLCVQFLIETILKSFRLTLKIS